MKFYYSIFLYVQNLIKSYNRTPYEDRLCTSLYYRTELGHAT